MVVQVFSRCEHRLPFWRKCRISHQPAGSLILPEPLLTSIQTGFAEAFSRIQEIQTFRSRIGPFWRIYYPREFIDAMSVLNNFVEPFVERAILERRENVIASKEAAGEKINFTDSLSQFTSDRKVLRDQLVSTLLAGRGIRPSVFREEN